METKININEVEYIVKPSILSLANYKNIFGMDRDLGEDYSNLCLAINELGKINKTETDKNVVALKSYAYLSKITELSSRIAYAFIKEANGNFMNYEDWAKTLGKITKNSSWIKEVVGITSSVF